MILFEDFFYKPSYNKSGRFWSEFLSFVNNSKTGSFFILSDSINALNDRNNIILFNKAMLKIRGDRRVELPCLGRRNILGDIDIIKSSKVKVDNKNEYLVDRDKFEKGLFVRNWKEGDKISFKKGTKKVSDLFIDSKVPLIKKSIYPIIEDFDGDIIWIPGLFSKENKIKSCNILLKWKI